MNRARASGWAAFLFAGLALLPAPARADDDVYLAEAGANPGKLWRSDPERGQWVIHHRAGRPDAAFPHAIMKLSQTALGPDGAIYYCSGLDGCLMHLLDGRNEIMPFEFRGQVRDLATTGEEHTLYFSVVPTPQGSEALADGKIYRRDFWEGAPQEVAVVRQRDVGGDWWGTFAIRDGAFYVATLGAPSRIYRLVPGAAPERVFEQNPHDVRSLCSGSDGAFYFTDAAGVVFRTTDFQDAAPAIRAGRRWSDVAVRPSAEAPRP